MAEGTLIHCAKLRRSLSDESIQLTNNICTADFYSLLSSTLANSN